MNGMTILICVAREGHVAILESLLQHYRLQCYSGVDPTPVTPAADPVAMGVVSTSRTLCVTTLIADESVYLNIETTQELVQMLEAEYNQLI